VKERDCKAHRIALRSLILQDIGEHAPRLSWRNLKRLKDQARRASVNRHVPYKRRMA
jgi:hypothetical protein